MLFLPIFLALVASVAVESSRAKVSKVKVTKTISFDKIGRSHPFGKAQKLKVLHEWKRIDYVWKNPTHKLKTIACGAYDYKRIYTMDVDQAKDGRMFITTGADKGIPATLSTISKQKSACGSPLLKPYPNWSWHENKKCKGLTSVSRIKIDACNRLWVLDSGTTGGDNKRTCPAQLLAFDLATNKLIKRVIIPNNVANPKSKTKMNGILSGLEVHTQNPECKKTTVFIADSSPIGGLIVYDLHKTWRLDNTVFGAVELAKNFSIGKMHFQRVAGIRELAICPQTPEKPKQLYFHALSSYNTYSTSLCQLQKSWKKGSKVTYHQVPYVCPSHMGSMRFSSEGILFFGLIEKNSIGCWNMNTDIKKAGNVALVEQDNLRLQGVVALKVIKEKSGEKLLVSSNSYHKTRLQTRKFTEVNFRILTASVETLVKGTKCEPTPRCP